MPETEHLYRRKPEGGDSPLRPHDGFPPRDTFLVETMKVLGSFAFMLLSQPSEDGMPNVVVNRVENAFGFPSMPVGIPPASQNQVQFREPVL